MRRAERGSLSLEAAMAVPVVALCALALLQLVAVARDVLLAQELARLGARVAATSPADGEVHAAVTRAAGPDVEVEVTIDPSVRGRGDTVDVQVVLRRAGRWPHIALTGRAVAHGEPQLERGSP